MSGSSPRENQPSSTSGASSDLSVDLDRAARSCPGRHWALRRGRRSSCSPHFGGRHIECAALAVGSRSVCRPVDARMCSRALLPAWAWGGRDGAPQGSVFAMLAAVGFLRCGLCAVRQPAPWPLRLCLTALRLPCGLRPTPACMLALSRRCWVLASEWDSSGHLVWLRRKYSRHAYGSSARSVHGHTVA